MLVLDLIGEWIPTFVGMTSARYDISRMTLMGLFINFGERKVEIKRKVGEIYRMSFDVLILNILLILSKKVSLKKLNCYKN